MEIKRRCRKFLSYDYPRTARQALSTLVAHPESRAEMDDFGRGALHDRLEERLRQILGKESAVFMPTGRVAQLAALKSWCDERGNPRLAMHPRCHIEEYEDRAYAHVYHLEAVPLGPPDRPTCLRDLEAMTELPGAVVIEIPLLALGCVLPRWEELVAISQWARARGIPLHADGARLWEIGPHYRRPYHEIAALFDTITVSFYKALNAMAGGAVAGPASIIRQVRGWQQRLGAAPFRMYPMVLDALRGLDEDLPRMPELYDKAQRLAKALAAIPGVRIQPQPPHSNALQVFVRGRADRLLPAALQVAASTGLWLVDFQFSSPRAGYAMFPLTVGAATLDVSETEAVAAVELLAWHLHGKLRKEA